MSMDDDDAFADEMEDITKLVTDLHTAIEEKDEEQMKRHTCAIASFVLITMHAISTSLDDIALSQRVLAGRR